MTIRWVEGRGGDAIAMDDTHFPIVVATWFGAATEPAVRAYFTWLHALVARSVSERVPVINVTDAGPAGNPSAEVRRLIAELSLDLEKKGGLEAFVYPAYVVIENALIRGALTAIGWMHGNMRVKHVGTCPQALDLALADLAHGGHRAPTGLDPRRWRRPARP